MSEKEMDVPVVTLTLEDDSELECAVLAVFPVEGYEDKYAALLPIESLEDENEDGEIFLYRYKEIDEDNLDITNIEDDEEFEAVSEAFDAILDEEEFNSL
ncbi:MAG: DUF1292 domain-containing protein [Lachnospira sp.]|nr:DUF1292 domain-containing protein [Lachnospira sp.]